VTHTGFLGCTHSGTSGANQDLKAGRFIPCLSHSWGVDLKRGGGIDHPAPRSTGVRSGRGKSFSRDFVSNAKVDLSPVLWYDVRVQSTDRARRHARLRRAALTVRLLLLHFQCIKSYGLCFLLVNLV
jgi:nitrite reductase/ring-hydroxylating ferredoxin subunit